MSTAAIVIPCFNEEKRLDQAAFERFAAETPEVSYVFVDDGSVDDTKRILEKLADRLSGRASVVALEENSGKAEAVRRGVNRALEQQHSYVGFWDADLATPLDVIREFSGLLDTHPQIQMIMGARVQLLGRRIERSPLRHYAGRIAATAISTVLGLRVYDTQCGAKLFRATPFVRACFEAPFVSSWIFDVEIIARMTANREAASLPPMETLIYELPLNAWTDVAGSKVRPLDFARAMFEMARIHRRYLAGSGRDKRSG
jgi:dolichyl-phosphate beta-glucosyltransferase